jgi:large subunit ribosomal protein L31
MKKDIHPKNYRQVLFKDVSCDAEFLLWSTMDSKDTAVYSVDKKEYPLVKVEISSESHPFYTGNEKIIDTAGRIDKFKNRQAASKKK